MCPIEGLSNAGSVQPPRPRPGTYFDEPNAPFDERRARAPPEDNDLLSERQNAFNPAVLGPGAAAPLLYGRVEVIKSLDFGGVLRGWTLRPT